MPRIARRPCVSTVATASREQGGVWGGSPPPGEDFFDFNPPKTPISYETYSICNKYHAGPMHQDVSLTRSVARRLPPMGGDTCE